jgi:uncharacterized protein (TIGR03118 family)
MPSSPLFARRREHHALRPSADRRPRRFRLGRASFLLVGNFGDGRINAFARDKHGRFHQRGTLKDADGKKLTIDGLWALEFGNAGSNGDPNTLFFTAGPDDETHGLFGKITAVSAG